MKLHHRSAACGRCGPDGRGAGRPAAPTV